MSDYYIKFVNEDGTYGIFNKDTNSPLCWFVDEYRAKEYLNYLDDISNM